MIGKTLGHYQITSQIGKGGMGEVYQAKDQKLGRDVAIKVLPEEFAKDADRVARFQREAKLLASLNHPNIAAIYGLEESGGTNFLVLELVEGETLADRIAGKDAAGTAALPEILKIALQIADALEAAHEKGIIHRDLKPANIKVTPDGKVKVLDFGLAKAYAGENEEVNLSNSPTLSNAATRQGVILGTAAYMSPEQARGETVDKKADIWAFGVVLFEMLTGRGMFEGRTVSDTLAAVLLREPEWKRLPPGLHPRIRFLLERCLEKEAKNRYSGIADARVDIQKVLADPGGVLVQSLTAVEHRTRLRTMMPWIAAVLGIVIAGVAVWKLKPPEPRDIVRFEYDLPEGQQFSELFFPLLAVSPDGKQFVYSTPKGLYLRSLHELTAKLIPGTEEHTQQPFFSPDGRWIGYVSGADSKLKKIAADGGTPVPLCDAGGVMGANWGTGDAIAYTKYTDRSIMRISANGGTPEVLTKDESVNLVYPQFLPDGKSLLYNQSGGSFQKKVIVQSLKSGKRKELFVGSVPRYVKTGHIVYGSGNNLIAVPFDLDRLEATGGPVTVVGDLFSYRGDIQYAVSESGTLVYVSSTGAVGAQRTLVWVDRKGKEEPLGIPPDSYFDPRISPDGKQVALAVIGSGNPDIWMWDVTRKVLPRLTFDPVTDRFPLWFPDGKRVAFHSDRNFGIYLRAADGRGKDEPLGSIPGRETFPCTWSADGKTLVVMAAAAADLGDSDIEALSLEGDPKSRPLLKEKYSEAQPRISPDGRWIAYTSNETGKYEVYVRPFPDVDGGRWQVSTGGGDSPIWSPDGQELFYRSGDAVMAVAVKTGQNFSAETPRILFRGTYVSIAFGSGDLSPWDISPDGRRFLMIKDSGPPGSTGISPRKITIVFNWFEELKQRVPVK